MSDDETIVREDGYEQGPLKLADAQLIAAAPDLLQAAKEVASWCHEYLDGVPLCVDVLEEAIAKAIGQ